MTVVDAVNRFLARVGIISAPPEPPLFLPGDICTSDPERRVPPEFLGNAQQRLPARGPASRRDRPGRSLRRDGPPTNIASTVSVAGLISTRKTMCRAVSLPRPFPLE